MIHLKPGIYVDAPIFYGLESAGHEHWNLDTGSQIRHALYVAQTGIQGIVFGSLAELVHLSLDEKARVVSTVRMALDQKGHIDLPLIVGVIHESLAETVKEIMVLKRCGASVALVLAPGYFGKVLDSQDGLFDWFNVVADASPLPIMISYYPETSNNLRMTADTVLSLSKHNNVVGIKLALDSMSICCQVALDPQLTSDLKSGATTFLTLVGHVQNLMPALTIGAQGAVDGMAAAFPRTVVRLYQLVQEGGAANIKEAQTTQYALCRAARLFEQYGPPALKYYVCRILELSKSCEECRAPLKGGLSDKVKADNEDDLMRLINIEHVLQNYQ